ncbi:MAG TPA: nitronate monooxygenase family protein [Terriglobales bacterium]|nr:nitronate monooxygenase family protein [Terriglobales bacterium]
MSIRTPICDLFGIEYPIFLAGMGQVAYAEVCAAVSEAGGFGTLGMVGASPERIREEMREVRRRTQKPFGVDLLAALPEQILASIDVIIEEGAAAFIAGLGVPGPVVERCHDAGLKVMSMCGKVQHAVRAEQAGCDVVVAQGTEAGGHTGQIATLALIPQIVDGVKIPVLGAGAIVDGRGLVAALALGAQGVWMGTRFIASEEANAAGAFKQRIVESDETNTTVTRCYSGKPMRVLRNSYVEEWERKPEEIQAFPMQLMVSVQNRVANYVRDARVDPDRTMMPAGQGAGAIKEVLPCREIIRRVMTEAEQVIGKVGATLQ